MRNDLVTSPLSFNLLPLDHLWKWIERNPCAMGFDEVLVSRSRRVLKLHDRENGFSREDDRLGGKACPRQAIRQAAKGKPVRDREPSRSA